MNNTLTTYGLNAIIQASGPAVRVWMACIAIADPKTMQVQPFTPENIEKVVRITGLSKKSVSNALTLLCTGEDPRLVRIKRGVLALNPNLIYPTELTEDDLEVITSQINRAILEAQTKE